MGTGPAAAAGGATAGALGGMGSSIAGGLAAGLGGSLVSGLFGMAGSAQAYKRQKKLYKYQLRKGPSLRVEGLRRAGLNPILALQGGGIGSGGNVPSVAQTHALPPPDVAKSTKTTAEASMVKQALQQQIATARQQQHLHTAETDLKDAMAANETLKFKALEAMPQQIRTQLMATKEGGFWGWMQSLLGQGYNAWSAQEQNKQHQWRDDHRDAYEKRTQGRRRLGPAFR